MAQIHGKLEMDGLGATVHSQLSLSELLNDNMLEFTWDHKLHSNSRYCASTAFITLLPTRPYRFLLFQLHPGVGCAYLMIGSWSHLQSNVYILLVSTY